MTNGDFETGDFTGWTTIVDNIVNQDYYINDGTSTGIGCHILPVYSSWSGPRPAISGSFSVLNDQTNPASGLLSGGMVLPTPFANYNFSMDIEYESINPLNSTSQNITVRILDNAMNPIVTVFDAFASGVLVQVPATNISLDVTSELAPYAGQMIYIQVQNLVLDDCFPSQIDNISLTYTGSAIPTLSQWGLIILGLTTLIFGIVAIRQKNLRLA